MHLRIFTWSTLAVAVGMLASCASMSPQECKVANWYEVGQHDGARGEPLSTMQTRADDCGKAGVALNSQAYRQGRELGLRSYCRIENAVPLGLQGGSYAGVCPPAIDAVFQYRFQVARAVHDLRSEVRSLDERTETLERRLRDLGHGEERRIKEAPNDEERKKVRKSIDDERRDVRRDLSENDRRLRYKRDELRGAEWALQSLH